MWKPLVLAAPIDPPWLAELAGPLANHAVRERLGPDDWLALAIAIRPDAVLDPSRSLGILQRRGWLDAAAARHLSSQLAGVVTRLGWYRLVGSRYALVARPEALVARARRGVSHALAEAGRKPPVRDRRIEPGPSKRASSGRQPRSTAKPTTKREPAPDPPPADAPAPSTIPVRFAAAPAAAVAALLGGRVGNVRDMSLALRAHALAAAERFNDLIGLSSLRGVDSHAYQVETARRVLRVLKGRALLADEVGLGKTIEALMILREYELRGMARRVLVLVPPALVHHWRGELQEKGGLEVRTTLDAAVRRDPESFWAAEGIIVASLALARTRRHAETIRGLRWDMVIVDEAHHAKNRATLAWQLLNGLESRFLLLLTATPVETDLEELYNLVTLLRPGQFATPAAFRQSYVDPKDPTSPRNRERLRALLAEVMVRNTRARSGLALPPRFVTTVAVEPTPRERELYDAVVALVSDVKAHGATRLTSATLLLEAGSSPKALEATLERLADSETHDERVRAAAGCLLPLARSIECPRKDAAVLDVVRASGEQVLVFTRFRRTAEHLSAVLRDAGVEAATFHGGFDAEQKREALEAFRRGARCLVSTDVGGEGQNLQFCHVLVNYDLPWNPMAIEQRIGRLHRMGQTEPVRVLNLCARGTAEERLLGVLHDRLHLFELVVGEMDMVLGNLADDRDLQDRILSLYSEARTEADIAAGFDAIAEELGHGRARYEAARALDTALFGEDFET